MVIIRKIRKVKQVLVLMMLSLMILPLLFPSHSPNASAFARTNPREVTPIRFIDSFNRTKTDLEKNYASSFRGRNGEWVPIIPYAHPEENFLEVLPKSRDTLGLSVDSTFVGMWAIPLEINATIYQYLHMPRGGYPVEVGKPAVPVVTRFLEVPHDVDISISVFETEKQILEGEFNIAPTREPHQDFPGAPEPPFIFDETIYQTDAFYPADPNIVSLEGGAGFDPIIIRGHRIVVVRFYPVQFNPVKQQIRAFSKIEARLNFDRPGQVNPIPPRLGSPVFDPLLHGLILNYQFNPENLTRYKIWYDWYRSLFVKWPYFFLEERAGAEYLIITHDDFSQEAQKLADWKEKKGVTSKVVTTSRTGSTAADIAAYIQDAYDTWTMPPSYVLLVGDSEFIPPHYANPHPSNYHGGFDIATDLYYGTVDGTDYFPDICVGRLSVDTAAQADAVIQKIIDYERDPRMMSSGFYNRASTCAQFQDNNGDGYEDRRFVLTSEEIRDYLQTQGYNVERIYTTGAAVTPTNYNSGSYDNGDPLPPSLLRANGFAWDGDATDITNAINAGRFLVYHRDHGTSRNWWNHVGGGWGGSYDGWGDPHYTTGDIAGLTNGPDTPVVFSIECMGAWFDGEVDQQNDPALTRNHESFCEEFVQHANGGAIAAIGASRISYSGYNDQLARGFIDAIWPGFDPAFASGGLYNLGLVLSYGKVYMASVYGSSLTTFELFNLFGDPELPIWTDVPNWMGVTHPDAIGLGSQSFVVSVWGGDPPDYTFPIRNAKVCLRKEFEVYAVEYTDAEGYAYFHINPQSSGEMDITVTHYEYVPYEDSIPVTAGTIFVDPTIGPSGISVQLDGSGFMDGERVDIFVVSLSALMANPSYPGDHIMTTNGISFSESFGMPSGPVGPVYIIARGESGAVAITLFRRLPDQPLPNPHLYCQWDSSTWYINPGGGDPRWNNPDIRLYDTNGNAVASNDLVVGTTYDVLATIHNDAIADAGDTEVTFTWAFWGSGQKTWHNIGTALVTVPVQGTAVAEARWTPSITGHTCLMVTVDHPLDIDRHLTSHNKGQENTDVHPVSSPGEVKFTLGNPTETTGLPYLEARQVGEAYNIWPAYIQRDYPQVQSPEENRTVVLQVDAIDAKVGETRNFTVNAYIDGQLIGGVEVEVVVGRETATITTKTITPTPELLLPTAIMFSFISPLVLIVVVVVRRRR